MYRLVIWLALAFSFYFHPPIIRAISPIFIDQFERSNIGDWQEVQNIGSNGWDYCLDTLSPAHWKIVDGWMKLVVDGVTCTLVISPKSTNLITTENWQIDFDWRLDESVDMDRNFVWWWQDQDNWADVKLYGTGIKVQKVVAGNEISLDASQTTYPFQKDKIYHWTIKYQNQFILVYIDNQLVLTITDKAPYLSTSKSMALKISLGSKRSVSSFDNLQIFALDTNTPSELNVPYLKQTDPAWANLEYDTAKLWSTNPTFSRWGCALVSTTMILKYYHLDELPDGTPITPVSLNQWLLSQSDGYIGDGLINWLAISRLTGEISKLQGTPKLEYQRLEGEKFDQIIDALTATQPVILNIPGHFLVSTGFINPFDLTILDPAFIYRYFSQHQKTLLSARLFTPSYTDLSYILIVSDPEVEVNILDKNSSPISNQEQFIEAITDEVSSQTTSRLITQVRKPTSSTYKISTRNQTDQNSTLSVYTYTQTGEVTTHQPISQAQTENNWQLELTQTTHNSSPSQLIPLASSISSSWDEFISIIDTYQNQPNNQVWHYLNYLEELAKSAKQANTVDQLRYQALLITRTQNLPLPNETKTELLQIINSSNLVI